MRPRSTSVTAPRRHDGGGSGNGWPPARAAAGSTKVVGQGVTTAAGAGGYGHGSGTGAVWSGASVGFSARIATGGNGNGHGQTAQRALVTQPTVTMGYDTSRHPVYCLSGFLHSGGASQIAVGAKADAYPNRPIRIVVPFPPGASPTTSRRASSGRSSRNRCINRCVVDKRPRRGPSVPTSSRNPRPTGIRCSSTDTLTVVPNAYPNLPFDPVKDLAPITMVAAAQQLVMVHASVPVSSLKELVAYVKARPGGQFKFSSGGNGTVPHLAGEMLNHMAGLQMQHIPYKGGAPAIAAHPRG